MNTTEEAILDSMKHRGCGMRAASYEVAPQAWLPEACVWLKTETGLRRLWIHSFAHCFDAERLTYSNKFEADEWALVAARAIVDRAFDNAEFIATPGAVNAAERSGSKWQLARYCTLALSCFKLFR